MKTLYIDCGMGAAGDMLTAALYELLPAEKRMDFLDKLNNLGIPGVEFSAKPSVKCGITGTHISVKVNGEEESIQDYHDHEHAHNHEHEHDHEHSHEHEHNHEHEHEHEHEHDHSHEHEHHHEHEHEHGLENEHSHENENNHSHEHGAHTHYHSSLHDIEHIVRGHLNISENVKNHVLAIYNLIAEAESNAHGVPVSEIHFHEVGTMDAVADITAACLLFEEISADRIIVSPVHVGSGKVRCAHGILPVPAPATAYILKDVPIYGGRIQGELCTPTGAAILKHFANEFGDMPVMTVKTVGYGMGFKDFEAANAVRILMGETNAAQIHNYEPNDMIFELVCNLDDMTPEAIGFAMEQLFVSGAADVFTTPIGMKKSRPGTMLTILCREEKKDAVISCLFKNTCTIGIRENICKRYILDRHTETVDTVYGPIRKKVSEGYGVKKEKIEYEDLAEAARSRNITIDEIIKSM